MNDSVNPTSTKAPLLTNRLYDFLKWVSQILLPALGALYFGLGEIWGLPKVTEVVGTITVIDLFLGSLVKVSHSQYQKSDARFDGHIHVSETDERKTFELNLDSDPDELDKKDEVLFRVNKDLS